jgi:hypothetical protein
MYKTSKFCIHNSQNNNRLTLSKAFYFVTKANTELLDCKGIPFIFRIMESYVKTSGIQIQNNLQ